MAIFKETRPHSQQLVSSLLTAILFCSITCFYLTSLGRPQRAKNLGRYEKSLEQEKLDEWGQPEPANSGNRAKSRRQRKKLRTADEDEDDDDFSSASESESEESDIEDIPNDEVWVLSFFLTS